MGNVDGVPVASQVKSAVQLARGDADGALETQNQFTQRCVGVAQLRSVVQAIGGDEEGATETQRRFLENSKRLMEEYPEAAKVADAVPGVSQVKSLVQAAEGDMEAALATQQNFSRRCPVVAQIRSAVEALNGNQASAAATQREFLQNASRTLDRVPVVGHMKAVGHAAFGDEARGEEAVLAANATTAAAGGMVVNGIQDVVSASADHRRPERPSRSPRGRAANHGRRPMHAWAQAFLSGDGGGAAGSDSPNPVQRPLTAEEITSCSNLFIADQATCERHKGCPICLQSLVPEEQMRTLPCFHVFHSECLDHWLRSAGVCPVCRESPVVLNASGENVTPPTA